MSNKEPAKIDFTTFPQDDDSVQIEGKLFMSDNFVDATIRQSRVARMDMPVQLSMTIILLCVEGNMKLKVNFQEYNLTNSMVATLLENSYMQVLDISSNFKGAIIAIARDFMDYTEDVKTYATLMQRTKNFPFAEISQERLKEAIQLYVMMKHKLMEPDFKYKSQVARAYLNLFKYNGLQSFIQSNQDNGASKAHSRRDEIFNRFIDEVQNHYKQERQVIFYANLLCITPKYLSSVIHEVSGKYATEWIDEYVIFEAKALLKNYNITIKEICQKMNFSTQSMFAKYFKKHTGQTPRDFRKK